MEDEQKPILDRINRIEGQIRGIRGMVEQRRACYDIVKQVAAVNGALRSLGLVIMKHHLHDCVSNVKEGHMECEELTAQLLDLFDRVTN